MARNDRSVVVVSEDAAFSDRIGALLRATPGIALTQCNTSLLGLNGKTSDLAQQSELIIFKAQAEPADDLTALREIVGRGAAARLLAVSDSTTPFGAAHSLLRAGVSEVVPDTLDDAELEKIVARLSASRRLTLSATEQKDGRLIVVSHARGGVGATTFAVNLANELGRQRRRFGRLVGPARKVVLVDLDLQFGTIASFLDLSANDALYTLVRDHLDPDSVFVDQSIDVTPAGFAVLAGPSRYLPLTAVTPDQIRALLRVLRQRFDFVVVDMPQVIVDWVSPVLDAVDRVQMVTGTSVPSIQQSRRLIDFYREQNPAVEIDIVVSKEKKPLLRSRRQVEAEKALGLPFRHWLPLDPRAADAAMDQGRPLSRVAPGSVLTKAVRGIAAEMLRLADASTAKAERQL